MAFVAVDALGIGVTEVQLGVFRPLVGLGQQHAVRVIGIDLGTDLLEDIVGLGQVFVVGAVALDQIRNGVETQPVDTHVQPVAHHRQHRFHHLRVVEIEVGLVRIETVPEVLAGDRVPGPVGLFGVEEDDPRAVVLLIVIRPHIKVARRRTGLGLARPLEPRVLIRGVVDDQLGDHPQTPLVRLGDKALGVGHGPVVAVYAAVFGNVVTVIATWRRIEWQ